jgi:hypothetical protein
VNRGRMPSRLMAAALLLLLYQSPAVPAATAPDDPQFRAQYSRQYDLVKSLGPDMVVEELRLRVELVASRGSQVGAASNDRRVRGFESALLKGLQDALCQGGKPRPAPQARPSPTVIDSVAAAANAQQLRTVGADVPELSALAQRLVDSQTPARWCALRSLDEVR